MLLRKYEEMGKGTTEVITLNPWRIDKNWLFLVGFVLEEPTIIIAQRVW